jgi:hypothetical protein
VNNRIAWRGDSGLRDGSEEDLDLSKGMYDAGDLIKFGFPMAFTATMLSWAILEYGDQLNAVKQLGHAQDSLKWITDYLINAHPSANVLFVQVARMDYLLPNFEFMITRCLITYTIICRLRLQRILCKPTFSVHVVYILKTHIWSPQKLCSTNNLACQMSV